MGETPPAGATFAYEVLSEQVVRQLSEVEALDTKLGVAIAALVAIGAAIYSASPPPIVAGIASGWLLIALIEAVRGFWVQPYAEGINIKFLSDARLQLDKSVIQWHAIEVLKAAKKANTHRIDRKSEQLARVVLTIGLVAGAALVGKMIGAS